MTAVAPPLAPHPPRPRSAAPRLPFWLRAPRRKQARPPAPTPRDARWWVGVVWLVLSALLLGLVAHVAIVGSLQHARSQQLLYQQVRTDLANAVTPLGQLTVDEEIVPNGTPIALLEIGRLGISEVVVQGTTSADLAAGPGHRRDTVFPGQEGTSVIMGRQSTYGGPFAALHSLVPGDVITVTTGQGVQRYEVFGVRREGDLLPEPLASGEGRLELITADGLPLAPSGTLHIDASLESNPEDTPSPVFTEHALEPAEWQMASDPGGLFAMVFWLQWLTIAVVAVRWARAHTGIWQLWTIAFPVLLVLGAATASAAMTALPNLL